MEMRFSRCSVVVTGTLLLGIPLMFGPTAYAAKSVNLSHLNVSVLQSFILPPSVNVKEGVNISEISRSLDKNDTLHVRIQETYSGYPVWGADAVLHIPNGANVDKSITNAIDAAKHGHATMNGMIYQDIQADLAQTPPFLLTRAYADKLLQTTITNYQHKTGNQSAVKDKQSTLMVYIDKAHKARWTYKISFYVEPAKTGDMPAKPVYIVDAMSSEIYAQWNDIKTLEDTILDNSSGGGYGGNIKMGKLVFDGLANNLPKLNIKRDAATNLCYMQNDDVTVKNYKGRKVMSFTCNVMDETHNNTYWNGEVDKVNDGYSPMNDALFGGAVIKDMYQKWYNVPVLSRDGKPMMLNMIVHYPIDNAFWDGQQMTFGDGVRYFYPLTSLGVAAHEISHGFTEQHSRLAYHGQSGGMNESYSDMAAQAAEFYAYGKNSWQIGPEIFKAENQALRYMDQPSKDCKPDVPDDDSDDDMDDSDIVKHAKPGQRCSIDSADQYYDGLDVHYSSGVYNRLFYTLGTSEGWDVKKAFDVMVHANQNYWTSTSSFNEGACGVLKAARDLKYNTDAVLNAFKVVGINAVDC